MTIFYFYDRGNLPITTKFMSTIPNHGKVCLIQHYVIKVLSVTCNRSVVFSSYSVRFLPPIKLTATI